MEISVGLWFDQQAEEAIHFYSSIFEGTHAERISYYDEAGSKISGQPKGSVLTVVSHIENLRIEALNGGPLFKFTPALSFYVSCGSEKEISEKWRKLSEGGKVRMELQNYPWSEKYGWVSDKYGVDWQLTLGTTKEKVSPALLFTNELLGRAEEAVRFYTSLFPNSQIESLVKDPKTNAVIYSAFTLNGQSFVMMEGPGTHEFQFTNANSLSVSCDNQGQIDLLWEKLSASGQIEECGWLKDQFGVSWQIVPAVLEELTRDPKKSPHVMEALLKMKKLDIEELIAAGNRK